MCHHSNIIRRGALAASILLSLCLFSTSAFADAGFQYVLQNKISQTDGAPPTLVLEATDIIKSGTITLESSTARSQKVKVGRMNPGARKEIPLKIKPGTHTFTVSIKATGVGDEVVEIPPFTLEVTRVAPISFVVDADGVDMQSRTIPFKVNRPLDRLELTFKSTGGEDLGTHTQNFGGQYGALSAQWPALEDVGSISIKVIDVDEFWTSVLLEPWWIEIEHKDVNFDSGKFAINAGEEEQKLKDSIKEIREQMKIHAARRAGMRLYVAGYTDTVGPSASNMKLSAQRACSISAWFQKNGVDMPVYYQGFGESVLKVKTEDNVDEARNRRAVYLLGNAAPPASSAIPRASWKRAGKSCN